MLTPTEFLLKAENYVTAAQLADEHTRVKLLEQAAIWRRRAFELQMLRFEHLKELQDMEGPDPNPGRAAD
jgi:hypothetical protein